MSNYNDNLWVKILLSAEEGEVKYFIKIPESETFPILVIQGTSTMDRRVIRDEINKVLEMLKLPRPTNFKFV